MRTEQFIKDKYYYLSNKGANQEKIFLEGADRSRFIFLITHFQSPAKIYNVAWYTKTLIKNGLSGIKKDRIDFILRKRQVELIAFTITENSFHILVKNMTDGILSVYMHRVLTAYSKYYNSKYNKKGHVFEGPFKAVDIKNTHELSNVSAHIHKNLDNIEYENYREYPYSSYKDYTSLNRWGDFLLPRVVLKQFKNPSEYKDFVAKNTH